MRLVATLLTAISGGMPLVAILCASRPATPSWLGLQAPLIALVALATGWAIGSLYAPSSGSKPSWIWIAHSGGLVVWLGVGIAQFLGWSAPVVAAPWVHPNEGMTPNGMAIPWWAIVPACILAAMALMEILLPALLVGAAVMTLLTMMLGGPTPMMAKWLAVGIVAQAVWLGGRLVGRILRSESVTKEVENPVFGRVGWWSVGLGLFVPLVFLALYRLNPSAVWAVYLAAFVALVGTAAQPYRNG